MLTLVDPVCSRFAQTWDLVNYNLTDYSRKDFVVAYENLEPQEVQLAESRFRTHLLFGREFIACYSAYIRYVKFRVVAKNSPCTLSPYRLETMKNYEKVNPKRCRGCLREVLLLGILQRLWLMRGGCLRAVVARCGSTVLAKRIFLALNIPCVLPTLAV